MSGCQVSGDSPAQREFIVRFAPLAGITLKGIRSMKYLYPGLPTVRGVIPFLLGIAGMLVLFGWSQLTQPHQHRLLPGDHALSGDIEPIWVATYSSFSGGPAIPLSAAFSSDGRLAFVSGVVSENGNRSAIATNAYVSDSGQLAWKAVHRPGYYGAAVPAEMVVCMVTDRVYITGWEHGRHNARGVTLAYEARNGRLAWRSVHVEHDSSGFLGRRLTVAPDGGRLFVIGQVCAREPATRLIAYDTEGGAVPWSVVLGRQLGVERLVATLDGPLLVQGKTRRGTLSSMAFDPADGRELWHTEDEIPVSEWPAPTRPVSQEIGRRMVVANTTQSEDMPFLVAVYNRETNEKLCQAVSGTGTRARGTLRGITVSSNGEMVLLVGSMRHDSDGRVSYAILNYRLPAEQAHGRETESERRGSSLGESPLPEPFIQPRPPGQVTEIIERSESESLDKSRCSR